MGTREEILAAAATVMRTKGYAHATTKEIAKVAGYSEATLYKHFADKTDIFLRVLTEQLPELRGTLRSMRGDLDGSLRENLTTVTVLGMRFYRQSFPIAMSLFSSHELLNQHRAAVAERAAGPRQPLDELAEYLAEQRAAGNLATETDTEAMAALILGACFQRAFLDNYTKQARTEAEDTDFARRLVDTVLPKG